MSSARRAGTLDERRRISGLRVACGSVLAAPFLIASAPSGPASPASDTRAVAVQIATGKKVFGEVCAACHGMDQGQPSDAHSASLKGQRFLTSWSGKPARALYGRILSTMPQNDPGSLEAETVLNLTAFILAENGQALPDAGVKEPSELSSITIGQ